MRSIPRAAEPLIQDFAGAFSGPTYQRFVVLLPAAILGSAENMHPFRRMLGYTLRRSKPRQWRVLTQRGTPVLAGWLAGWMLSTV